MYFLMVMFLQFVYKGRGSCLELVFFSFEYSSMMGGFFGWGMIFVVLSKVERVYDEVRGIKC